MKILIDVLIGMLRNMSLSCWSVSDRDRQSSRIVGYDGDSSVQMHLREIVDPEGLTKRDPCGCQFDMRGIKPKMLCKTHKA